MSNKEETGSSISSETPLMRAKDLMVEENDEEDIIELERYNYNSSDDDFSDAPYYRYIEKKICCTKQGCIRVWKVTGFTVYGVSYISVTCIVDGFDLQEFVEFLTRKDIEGWALMGPGLAISGVTQIPIFLTIVFNRKRGHGHQHSVWGNIREILVIGGPFSMVGSAAFINFMRKFNPKLPFVLKFISVPFGLLYGISQWLFHGFFIHEAQQEFGNRPGAFFRAVYRTFFQQGWKNFFLKFAIMLGHFGEGLFDGRTFVEEWGIDEISKTIGLVIKIFIPIMVILFHGLSESFAYDQAFNQNNTQYMRTVYGLIFMSGMLHVIPGLTGVAEILLGTVSLLFGVNDWLAALLCMLATVGTLAYPNIRGYMATTIGTFNEYFGHMLNQVGNYLRHGRQAEDYADIDRDQEEGQANNRHRFNLQDHPLNQEGDLATGSRCTIL